MKKIFSYMLIVFLLSVPLQRLSAQDKVPYPFSLPHNIPVPDWVKKTDWTQPNVHEIAQLMSAEKHSHENSKKQESAEEEHEMEREKKKESESEWEREEEEPYAVAYQRWYMRMQPFIQQDGSIKYDAGFYKNQLQQAIEAQSAPKKELKTGKTTSAANWTILGPVESFYSGGGAKGSDHSNVYLIAIAPSNPNILYIGTETGTLLRSADKGLHWTSINDQLPPFGVTGLVVDPTDANTLYCCSGGVMIKTTSAGAVWTNVISYTGGNCEKLIINPTTGRIIASGANTIQYSDDKGVTWNTASGSSITGSYWDVEFKAGSKDTVFALGNDASNNISMMRSVNGGTSFSAVTAGLSGIRNDGGRIAVSPADPNTLYCILLDYTSNPRLIKSINAGTTWTVTATGSTASLPMDNWQGFYDLDIMVNPADVNDVIVGTASAYKSTDGGVNFSILGGYGGLFNLHPDIQCMRALGGDAYITTDGSVGYSSDFFTNTANHSIRNHGISSTAFWGFSQGWDEDIIVGGAYHNGDHALYEAYGKGNNLNMGGGESATGHVFHGKERTVAFNDLGTFVIPKNLADPNLWAAAQNSKWPNTEWYDSFHGKLIIDPRYSNTYYVSSDSTFWKSVNNGVSYTALYNFGSGNNTWRFDIARSNPNCIYLCTTDGVYKSTDGGTAWTKLSLPFTTYNYYNTDIAVDAENEKIVYFSMPNSLPDEKIYKSTDGGITWTNITGGILNNKYMNYIQCHGGTDGGIYTSVLENSTVRIYYRDNTMSDWISFSDGLPNNLCGATVGALIFYRDSKIRMSGYRGVWESPLYTTGRPLAQPMADKKFVHCTRDTVNFFDYSMIDYSGASVVWSFPGASYVSSTTARRPKVTYSAIGKYTVTLTITDKSGLKSVKTIPDMIEFDTDNCYVDTVAGKCLNTKSTIQNLSIGKANINSNTFSISCWIKPNGLQSAFAQILGHYGCPGSPGYGISFGFSFSGYASNLRLSYTDDNVNYGHHSGLVCDTNQWNYVVLTYSPSGVKLYLNGVGEDAYSGAMPPLDLSQSPFYIGSDNHGQGAFSDLLMDEIKIYDYTLTQDQVREKMHLINNKYLTYEPGLLKYLQFNLYDPIQENVYELIEGAQVYVPNVNIVKSTAPVATGTFFRRPMVNSGGLSTFPNADINLYLPKTGIYPNGEMVAFHLNSGPDENPDTRAIVPGYFILNNFGANAVFSRPDSIRFSNLKLKSSAYAPGNFKLYKRGSTFFGPTWGTEVDSAVSIFYKKDSASLTWKDNMKLSNMGQMVMVNYKELPPTHISSPVVQSVALLKVYPNPNYENRLFIDLESKLNTKTGISLYDMQGRQVYHSANDLVLGKNTLLLNLQGLSPGTYIVNISPEAGLTINEKVILE